MFGVLIPTLSLRTFVLLLYRFYFKKSSMHFIYCIRKSDLVYFMRMKQRSYNQYCGLAYALDMVGERWTILIIRELVVGSRRFTDLLNGLPEISTNLLSERLKSLEQRGMIRRRTLPPPAGSTVYELTAVGRALEPTLLELGKWGSQFVPPDPGEAMILHAGSYALTLKTFFRPELAQGLDETYALHIDDEVLQVRIHDGSIDVQQGEPVDAVMALHSDIQTYLALLNGDIEPEQVLATGLARVEGDVDALRRFLAICGIAGAPA